MPKPDTLPPPKSEPTTETAKTTPAEPAKAKKPKKMPPRGAYEKLVGKVAWTERVLGQDTFGKVDWDPRHLKIGFIVAILAVTEKDTEFNEDAAFDAEARRRGYTKP